MSDLINETPVDMVSHPPHYKGKRFECIEVIEAHRLGFHLGNAFKYLFRHQHKGNPKQDLEKACWYLERYLGSGNAREEQIALWRSMPLTDIFNQTAFEIVLDFMFPRMLAHAAADLLVVSTDPIRTERCAKSALLWIRQHIQETATGGEK